jgi:uncharacterized repeat protein (TIGR01451 family)
MDRKLLKPIFLLGAFLFFFLVFGKNVFAAWYCEPVYGGGERCWGTGEVVIDKTVKNPQTGNFVDNLGISDPKFAFGQEVLFRLEIKNTGQGEFSKVTVKDVFPSYLDFVRGPEGWNPDNRALQFDIYNLKAGESRQFEITAKIFEKEKLPSDRNLFCVFNSASVEADGKTDSDQSQICFEEKVLGVKTLPPTGVNLWLLALGFLGIGVFGTKLAFKNTW